MTQNLMLAVCASSCRTLSILGAVQKLVVLCAMSDVTLKAPFSIITVKEKCLHDNGYTLRIIYFLGVPIWKKITAFDVN